MKKSIMLALLFCMIVCLSSCFKDSDDYVETYSTKSESGRNVLSFTFNGEFIHQTSIEGGISTLFMVPTKRYTRYYDSNDNNTKIIYALLGENCENYDKKFFTEIHINLPKDNVYDGAVLYPEIELTYVYLPRIWHWGEKEYQKDGGGYIQSQVIDRAEEFRNITIEHSSLTIRKWDEKRKILAGDFTMRGFYTDSTETVIPFNVQDGLFDVTDSYVPLND